MSPFVRLEVEQLFGGVASRAGEHVLPFPVRGGPESKR